MDFIRVSALPSAPPMPHVPPVKLLDGRAAFAYVDDVRILILDSPAWSDADMYAMLSETTRLAKRVDSPATMSAVYGAMFDSRQRKLIVEWLEKEKVVSSARNAMISESALTRGALTAYAWLTRIETKAFGTGEVMAACEWVARGLVAKPTELAAAFAECDALLGRGRSAAQRA